MAHKLMRLILKAIGATLLISAAPFFILFFIPLDNSQEKQWLLKEGPCSST
jgi:zinc transporter 7